MEGDSARAPASRVSGRGVAWRLCRLGFAGGLLSIGGIAAGIAPAVWLSADAPRIASALFFVFVGSRIFLNGLRE